MATDSTIQQAYESYIAAINAKDWKGVTTYTQPSVTHNDNTYTSDEYADMIRTSSAPFSGIKFIAEKIVADDKVGRIACRIKFEWDGETFYEHVFYELENGKIASVWAIVDFPKQTSGA